MVSMFYTSEIILARLRIGIKGQSKIVVVVVTIEVNFLQDRAEICGAYFDVRMVCAQVEIICVVDLALGVDGNTAIFAGLKVKLHANLPPFAAVSTSAAA